MTISPSDRERLHAELDRVTRRRRTRTGLVTLSLAALATVVVWRTLPAAPPTQSPMHPPERLATNPSPATTPTPEGQATPAAASSVPTIVRWTALDAPPIERLSDDQLLDRLAHADEPAGLIEYQGKTTLVRLASNAPPAPAP